MNGQLLECDDPAWDAFVAEVPHDFYHLPGYVRMSQNYDRGRAQAVLIRDGDHYFFLPYLVRSLAELACCPSEGRSWSDISSPYGYPGPLVRGPKPFVREAAAQWIDAMRASGAVSAFLRTHPLLPPNYDVMAEFGDVVYRGDTITIDLELSLEDLWRQTRQDHRRNINRARREGLTATVESDLRELDAFMRVYTDTMDRVGASAFYYFPREYFVELKEVLGEQLSLCAVRDGQGNVVAAGMFTECDGIVQFHLSGTSSEALKLQPSKLMLDEVRRWAKARGNRWMHLGGGNGASEDNPLFRFKAGFSHLRQPFYTWQLIFSPDAYQALENRHDELAKKPRSPEFFPSYRA